MSLFDAAFPISRERHRAALSALRERADEPVHYSFSFPVAQWLARRCPGELSIDWADFDDTSRLDELLARILQPAEEDYFDSGWVDTRDWIDQARSGCAGTDFDWLMSQLADRRFTAFWNQLYDAADIPLVWDVGRSRFSKAQNRLPGSAVHLRASGMRRRPRWPKREIMRPLSSVQRLSKARGARLIDMAMASLAVRYRETYHFNYANPREVYLADVGEGVSVAVFGLLPQYRFPLETTMGFLVLANGIPVGYGGSSVLFHQVNTGINIFDDFRGSEAAFIWTQVMRVYHHLVGCTRFIANPYQFGGDNDEALKSGAFWFYYRLGFRPVEPGIRKLARDESAKISANLKHRTSLRALKQLATCDMHLTLPGAKASEFFDERWFDTVSMLATRALARPGADSRRRRASLEPILAAVPTDSWRPSEKRLARQLLRAKAGETELAYAKLLVRHDKLLNSLKKACRRADSE